MRKQVSLILLMVVPLSGCAVFEVDSLKSRVSTLEEKVDNIEYKEDSTVAKEDTVTYVSSVEIESATPSGSTSVISMTNTNIQRALKNAGYYTGPIDGKLGPQSRDAMKKFQADKGLKVDGIAGTQTKQALDKYLK